MAKKKKKNSATAMPMADRGWMARDDARTLANAAEITKDKPRANRAVKAAEKEAKDAAKAVKTVAKQAGVRKRKKK